MVSYFEDNTHARQVAGAIRKPALGALALALHLVYAPAALAQVTLLSQGKPAFASSVQGGATPNLAVDGQLQSRWESVHQKDPQWLYVDLGARASITKVVVQWENASARTFELQVSDDEVTWEKVGGVDDNQQLVNEFNLATEARYVRVHGTQRTTGYGYSIFELGVYGSGGDPGGGTRPNIALHAPVRASSNESQQPGANPNLTPRDYLEANINDNDRQTRWSSAYRDTEWVQVDLGSSQWIGAVELDWEDAHARAYDLQVSNDGVNWRTVYRNLGATGGVQNTPLYENGRHVRMQGIQRATQYGYSMFELRAYPWRDGDPKPLHAIPPLAQPSQVVVGKGSYEVDDSSQPEPPPPQYRTEGVKWPIASNDWWQSLLISNLGSGSGLVTLPLRSKYTRNGLSLTTIDAGFVTGDGNAIETARQPDLYLMPESVAPDRMQTRVDGHGDYSVSVIMSDDASAKMRSTLVQGSPYVYNTFGATAGRVQLSAYNIVRLFDSAGNTILDGDTATYDGDVVGIELASTDEAPNPQTATRYYGVFAPAGSRFLRVGGTIKITLGGGQDYLSLATMPAASDLSAFQRNAYAFVTGTRVDYRYDQASAEVTTDFASSTELKRPGFPNETLMGLLPHQWKISGARTGPYRYPSIRGEIRVAEGNSFTTVDRFHGLIPQFVEPRNPEYSRAKLVTYLDQLDQSTSGNLMINDPYWQGKALHPLAAGVLVAEQMGDRVRRDAYLAKLRPVLTDWLSYTPGETKHGTYFHYVRSWGSLVAYHTGFGLNTGLTDHHFTYGYFAFAAAVLASYDKDFLRDYGPMVELLIRDYASPSRTDPLFPQFRNFSPYVGHSWAGGFGDNPNGNNQEAAGEALVGWLGQYLWGVVTDNPVMRDAGIYGFTTEERAIENYWFDYDRDIRLPEFAHTGVGQVYGSSYAYRTYFDPKEGPYAPYVYGIHWLPTAEWLTYYGRDKSKAARLYEGFVADNGGPERSWEHIIWPFQALSDPQAVLAKFDGSRLQYNEAFNAYWFVNSMASLGERTSEVWALDWPAATVYRNAGGYTAQVWNPTDTPRTVRFTNGSAVLGSATVPARATVSLDPTRANGAVPAPPSPVDPYLPRAGWKVSASSGDATGNMLDGNPNTRWTSGQQQVPGQWIVVDLQAAKTFDSVFLNAGNGGDYPHGYKVQVSDDGQAWVDVADGNEPGQTTAISFARRTARYLRIEQLGTSGSWWSITELKLALFGGGA
ncbi:discoidin domain-containing protein [Massilia niastensis]|uniref:discoidin domain-containing protein n=1 Tax=Massilia niastensis TaxID=544911 RepID=UPI0003A64484|nr:discoidin domain-containing protein [Massilia niastensis]